MKQIIKVDSHCINKKESSCNVKGLIDCMPIDRPDINYEKDNKL